MLARLPAALLRRRRVRYDSGHDRRGPPGPSRAGAHHRPDTLPGARRCGGAGQGRRSLRHRLPDLDGRAARPVPARHGARVRGHGRRGRGRRAASRGRPDGGGGAELLLRHLPALPRGQPEPVPVARRGGYRRRWRVRRAGDGARALLLARARRPGRRAPPPGRAAGGGGARGRPRRAGGRRDRGGARAGLARPARGADAARAGRAGPRGGALDATPRAGPRAGGGGGGALRRRRRHRGRAGLLGPRGRRSRHRDRSRWSRRRISAVPGAGWS